MNDTLDPGRQANGTDYAHGFMFCMKHLFNREQMLKTLAQGYGVVTNDQPIGALPGAMRHAASWLS